MALIVATVCALLLADAAAGEPSLTASTRTVRPGQVINVGGTGWETFWAAPCPAALHGFISVSFSQGGAREHLASISPFEVWPISGGWNYDVRIPAGARPGRAEIVVEQQKAAFDLFRGRDVCHLERTLLRSVEVNVVGTPMADPPAPPAEIRLDSVIPAAGRNRARPGATLEVSASGFALPQRCRYGSGVTFSLTDASGTGTVLGGNFSVDGLGRVTDSHNRRRIYLPLPDDGLSPGPAAITATRAGAGVGCARTAGLLFRIVIGSPAVRVSPGSHVAGQVTHITGTNWRTDRCDRVVGIFLVEGSDRLQLAVASPKGLGAFSVETTIPAEADPGSSRIVAEQLSGLEVRDKTTRPGRTRCYYGKLVKRGASTALTVVGPLAPARPASPVPQCADRNDNDGDGRADLADPGCDSAQDDSESPDPVLPQCANGKDDDGDGRVDLEDAGCENAKDDSESPDPALPECADRKDNDGDGKVDLEDTGCKNAKDDSESPDPNLPQCSDGKDNDGDGNVDYPEDKECSAKDDDSEGK